MRIAYEFWLEDRRIAKLDKTLRYLNPRKAIREPIPLDEVISKHSDLFKEVEQREETKKIPKKTLGLHLKITTLWFPTP
ncbi:MAG: hypothetical protein J7J88_00375 [Dehalococcoidia bacterium]|nr:hypothetical protein [Dehalococcoidia bacterium]